MIEELLWGLLPSLAAFCSVLTSLFVAFRARRPLQFVLTGIVITLSAWALLILYRIFVQDAWPTYIPHFVIAFVIIIVLTQALLFRFMKRKAE